MSNKDFVHLHAHTHFSVQDALPSPKNYATKAREMGFSATAITDHGKMSGVVEFVEACRTHNDNFDPIKPIIGIEVYTCADRFDKNKTAEGNRQKLNHLTLLAQNETGYKNLLALSALGNDPEAFHYSPRVDWECIEKHSEGVIALSGCLASEVNQSLMKQDPEKALSIAKKFKDLFDDRYFVELQYHGIEEQRNNLMPLIDIAKNIGAKLVASNDVHYLDKLDWKLHDVLIQMRDQRENRSAGAKKNGKKEAYGTHQFYLKSHEEMLSVFGQGAPDSVKNSVLIADMVEDFLKLDVPHLLPKSNIPINDPEFKSFWQRNLPYNNANEAYLAYRAFSGLKNLGLDKNKEYMKRLRFELSQIWYMGVTDYFLIQNEMVEFMKGRNIYYGIRGSGVGSLVNYCLDVSSVDPIRWNLMFERFLNPGRGTQYQINIFDYPAKMWLADNGKMEQTPYTKAITKACKTWLSENPEYSKHEPDILKEIWVLENQGLASYICDLANKGIKSKHNDSNLWTAHILGVCDKKPEGDLIVSKVATLPDVDTDIDAARRSEVIDWAVGRFGADHVAQIGAWGTYGAKAAVVGALKTSDRFNEKYGSQVHQEAIKISGAIPKVPDITIDTALKDSAEFAHFYRMWREEIDIAKNLVGTISNLSVHAAGVLICGDPVSNHAPIENSKGNLCSGFDMFNVERVGLVKYDYLGLNTFTQIFNTIKMIKERRNIDIDIKKDIDFDDSKIYKNIYAKGKTASVFQFASKGMQDALRKVNASNMEDLIAVVSLYRPGPLEYIDTYAEGKMNPSSVYYPDPIVKKHLEVTYSIMVYQEQGMQLARDMAGFDHNEVDKLRKAISKKNDKLFAEVTDLFKKKSLERGFDERVVDSVLSLMSKFVGYAFNRSHACSYAILSFWTAWLRYYYPHEWLATCIQLAKDDEDKVKMLRQECQMEKIVIREPDINESGVDTRVNEKNEIMLPLSSIKGVGSRAEDIIKEQPYDDLKDFCIRARPNRGIVEALSKTSALDCIIEKDISQEDFMILWDNLVLERNNAEKKKLRDEKRESKLSVSMDKIVQPKKTNTNSIGLNSNAIKNLLSDNLFD
jgi:DNA polymerase III alpha subunit